MKRSFIKLKSFIKAVLISLATIVYSLLSLFTVLMNKPGWYFALASSWSSLLLIISGVRVKVSGKEKLLQDTSYIFISNHSSHFDIPVLLSSLSDMLVLIYKQELEKIPVFGFALARSPHISIDRSNPKKAMESIRNAVKKLEKGISVIVFPEGTRSKDGKMGEFKRGAFMLASRSGKPIVPVSISGTFPILPQNGFNIHGSNVDVTIHNVIDNYIIDSPADEKELMYNIKKIIENGIKN